MEIRGERECLECGSTWSYFEIGSVECPECGSIRSRSISTPERDTSTVIGIDTDELVEELGTNFKDGLSDALESCRSYVTRQGFVEGGDLQPPEVRYVMACEVVEICEAFTTPDRQDISKEEKKYVVDLVRGLRNGNPPDERPESLDDYHNLAVARTVERYAKDVTRYARSNGLSVPSGVEDARSAAKRTKATLGREEDAVKGLRSLRDVYKELTEETN